MVSITETALSGRCLGTTLRGRPCRAWPTKGGDYCLAHSRPANDRDPPRPRLATIDDCIADMLEKLALISALVDQFHDAGDTKYFFKSLALYNRYITCLSCLLREKRWLPEPADDLLAMLAQAVDEVQEELGIELSLG